MSYSEDDFSVALLHDSMFQRVIAKRVVRRSELIFHLLDGTTRQGWVTGLDEKYLQLTDRDLTMQVVQLDKIVGFAETGTKFYEADFSDYQKRQFESFSNRFRTACEKALKESGDSAFYRKPEVAVLSH